MFDLAFGFLLAALPAAPVLLWLRRNDSARPEPVGLIGRGLLLGVLAVIPAAVLEYFLASFAGGFGDLGGRFLEAFIVAGLVEEGLKLAFLRAWLWKNADFDEATDGIVYAVSVSLGFAVVENFFYTWHHPELLVIRSLTAVPLHVLATGHLGFWLGVEKIRERTGASPGLPKGGWRRGLLAAVGIHGGYDFIVMGGDWPALLVVPFLLVAFGFLKKRFAIARDIDEAVRFPVDSL